jgi:hypothetical protein
MAHADALDGQHKMPLSGAAWCRPSGQLEGRRVSLAAVVLVLLAAAQLGCRRRPQRLGLDAPLRGHAGTPRCSRLLLERGADVNAKDNSD